MGNTSIISIIAKRRRLQTTPNWLVFSLTVADLCVTCGYFPASMVCNVLVESCNNVVRLNFAYFFMQASAFTLISAIIAERYIAIVHSIKYIRYFTTARRAVILIATSWVIPAILSTFRLIYDLNRRFLSGWEDRTIIIIYTLLFEVAPTVILIGINLHIL